MSQAFDEAVTFNWATYGQTAWAGEDFSAASGELTFTPGETLKTISVDVIDNFFTNFGEVKKFYVGLTKPENAIVPYNFGQATIVENDISISISDASVERGASAALIFDVRLSSASDEEVSVSYATDNGSASAADFVAASGTLTFAPGEISKLIHVELVEDEPRVDKPAAYMMVNLSSAQNALIHLGQAIGTIQGQKWREEEVLTHYWNPYFEFIPEYDAGWLDEYGNWVPNIIPEHWEGRLETDTELVWVADSTGLGPTVTIDNAAWDEVQDAMRFTARLHHNTENLPVSFNWATLTGTATAADFTPATGSVTFGSGQTEASFAVAISPTQLRDDLKQFYAYVTSVVNAIPEPAFHQFMNGDGLPEWILGASRYAKAVLTPWVDLEIDGLGEQYEDGDEPGAFIQLNNDFSKENRNADGKLIPDFMNDSTGGFQFDPQAARDLTSARVTWALSLHGQINLGFIIPNSVKVWDVTANPDGTPRSPRLITASVVTLDPEQTHMDLLIEGVARSQALGVDKLRVRAYRNTDSTPLVTDVANLTVLTLDAGVDGNRDGKITFDDADDSQLRFWVNNDLDVRNVTDEFDEEGNPRPDPNGPRTTDFADYRITTARDLEDFAAVHVMADERFGHAAQVAVGFEVSGDAYLHVMRQYYGNPQDVGTYLHDSLSQSGQILGPKYWACNFFCVTPTGNRTCSTWASGPRTGSRSG